MRSITRPDEGFKETKSSGTILNVRFMHGLKGVGQDSPE